MRTADISGMDAALASQITNANLGNQISTRVAKKALDVAKEQGDAAVQLIKAAAKNARSGGDNGLGGRLDVSA
jgi:hypothetical protein